MRLNPKRPTLTRADYEARFGPIGASAEHQRAAQAAAGGFLRESGIEDVYAQAYLGGADHEQAMRAARRIFQPGIAGEGVGPFGPQNKASIEAYLARQGITDPRAAATPARSIAAPPREDTILGALRAMAGEQGPDLPPPASEPVRFRATPEEMRLAGEMSRRVALEEAIGLPVASSGSQRHQRILASLPGGGGGAPPVVPPNGMMPAQAPLPSGRPRTGPVMAGSRFPGILGLGLATLGGIAGAIAQADAEDSVMSSEVAGSAALGLGGAGLLGLAAMRTPADAYLIRRPGR